MFLIGVNCCGSCFGTQAITVKFSYLQGEKWFQLRQQLRFKPTSNVSSKSKNDHAELLNKRLRALKQGASIMSKAVVPRASGEAMNYHSDYEFFRSRSL